MAINPDLVRRLEKYDDVEKTQILMLSTMIAQRVAEAMFVRPLWRKAFIEDGIVGVELLADSIMDTLLTVRETNQAEVV